MNILDRSKIVCKSSGEWEEKECQRKHPKEGIANGVIAV